jgi:polyferredoxin
METPGKRKSRIRLYIQIFFFTLIAFIAVNKSLEEAGLAAIPLLSTTSLHALCPFGGVVTLYNLFTVGTLIQKIYYSAIVLLALVLILTLFFGPVFCGWVCPLGSIQEWFGKLGRRIFKKRYNRFVPRKLDRALRYARFGVLIWVVFVTARSATLLFANADPYNALFTFWTSEVALPAVIILGVTLLGSLFIERPWCKYACPYGAMLGVFNKFRIFKIKRSESTCVSCNKCTKACPMNIDVARKKTVTDFQCISCFECTSQRACPVKNTVEIKLPLPQRAVAEAKEAAK